MSDKTIEDIIMRNQVLTVQLAATREKLRMAREGLETIEQDPTDFRTGSDENMERVREIARDTLAQIKEATNA